MTFEGRLSIRLSETDLNLLKQQADEEGISMSYLARDYVSRGVGEYAKRVLSRR